jgi:hypothetical protein
MIPRMIPPVATQGSFPTVSGVASARDTETVDVNIHAFLAHVRDGKWKEQILEIRKAHAEAGKGLANPLKEKLPAFMVSGRFSRRSATAISQHSGLLCVDLDELNGDLDSIRQRLAPDRHIMAMFVSPRGNGLKLFVPITPDISLHLRSFEATKLYFKRTYDLNVDEQCKDISRLCYASYDPDLIARADAEIIPPIEEKEKSKHPPGWMILPCEGLLKVSESAELVFDHMAKSRRLFIRGSVVVELTRSKDGALELDTVDAEGLRSRIDKHGTVAAWRTGSHGEKLLKPGAHLSLDTARVFLASHERYLLPPIEGIHACPILVVEEGGPTILKKGYHNHGGGRLITGGTEPKQMPVEAATEIITSALAEFDFVTPADKSRAVAAIISPALRMGELLICHMPLFVMEADETQTGKGYLLEIGQETYNEIPYVIGKRIGGVGSLDEDLSQALISGRPFIQLDNVRAKIDSQFLEMVLTCPLSGTVPCRVPHKGTSHINPHRFVFQLTSNGFESTSDLANRSCIVRLRKRSGYNFRRYPEGDLLDHVRGNQPVFLGAVHSIAAAWIASGKPRTDDTRGEGRFRQWAQSLDWIVQELCGLPPLMDGHKEAQARSACPALSWLRLLAISLEAQVALGEEFSATRLVEVSEELGLSIPGIREEAPEKQKVQKVGQIMGRIFKESEAVEVDSFIIERISRPVLREDGNGYRDAKFYRFCRK